MPIPLAIPVGAALWTGARWAVMTGVPAAARYIAGWAGRHYIVTGVGADIVTDGAVSDMAIGAAKLGGKAATAVIGPENASAAAKAVVGVGGAYLEQTTEIGGKVLKEAGEGGQKWLADNAPELSAVLGAKARVLGTFASEQFDRTGNALTAAKEADGSVLDRGRALVDEFRAPASGVVKDKKVEEPEIALDDHVATLQNGLTSNFNATNFKLKIMENVAQMIGFLGVVKEMFSALFKNTGMDQIFDRIINSVTSFGERLMGKDEMVAQTAPGSTPLTANNVSHKPDNRPAPVFAPAAPAPV